MEFFISMFFIVVIIACLIYQDKMNKERQAKIKTYAEKNGLNYLLKVHAFPAEYAFRIDEVGHSKLYEALLVGERNGITFCTFDYTYTMGGGKNSSKHMHTVCLLSAANVEFPDFYVRDENFFDAIGKLFGGQDINFTEDPTFSNKFVLQGLSEPKIREFFARGVRNAFVRYHQSNRVYEAHGDTFAVQTFGFKNVEERLKFLSECMNIFKHMVPADQQTLG